jgi:hypothetical protein
MVGTGKARQWPCWRHVHRALDHGFAKKACAKAVSLKFPAEIIQFANVFIQLQEQRHTADYDPHARFARAEVIGLIDSVECAIFDYKTAPRPDKLAFAVLVLLKLRTE